LNIKLHITTPNKISDIHQNILQRWKETNRSFELCIYKDSDNNEFVNQYFPEYRKPLSKLSKIQFLDIIRVLYLIQHGGLYADLDVLPLKDFSPLLKSLNTITVCKEHNDHAKHFQQQYIVSNAVIISNKPKNNILIDIIDRIIHKINTGEISHNKTPNEVLYSTGPFLWNEIYRANSGNINLLENNDFCPMSLSQLQNSAVPMSVKKSYAVHLHEGSWWTQPYDIETTINKILKVI
jgi:mannosyltransferase OCH1-like enzyme